VSTCIGDPQAIQWLKNAIAEGKHWYVALLEAVRLWSSSEEVYGGRHYHYLIDNEAFDWLVLAERLCEEIDDFVPEKERINLLFFDIPPIHLPQDEFKKLIGPSKYQAHLNYLYGILVEKFLILAVTEEIRKERRSVGLYSDGGIDDETYRRIYGATQRELVKLFRKEAHYSQLSSMNPSNLDEFAYWLFKYRVKRCDKSCVASDTKKALMKLHTLSKLKAKLR